MVGGGMGRLWTSFALLTLASAGPLHRYARESEDYQNDFSAYANYTANEVCFSEGEVFQKGDMMPNPGPCEECRCEPPSIVCNMIKCLVNNNGCRTIQRPNHCCPDYNCECDYNGQLYNDGERLELPEEPCQVCYCKGGEVMCNSITCYHRDDCDPIQVPGQCCPKYENCPVRDSTGSSSSEDKNILVRSTNKTNHVSPKREMNPWLLTKVPSVSSSSPKNTQDPTTEGGDIIIVSDWLSERRTTTEDATSPDTSHDYSSVSTDKPSVSTNVDHLTTDMRQDLNSDGAIIVKNSEVITPVDEVIFTRIDSPKQKKNVSLEGPMSINSQDAPLKLTSTKGEKVTTVLDITDTPMNSDVSNDDFEKFNSISNTPETDITPEILLLKTAGIQKRTEAPIKIQELTSSDTTVSTEDPIHSTTIESKEHKNELEKRQSYNGSSGSLKDGVENEKIVENKFIAVGINTNINQRIDTTDLQGPFLVEEFESSTPSNEFNESTTQIETKEELKVDEVSKFPIEAETTLGFSDLPTNLPSSEATTPFITAAGLEKNNFDKNHPKDLPKVKKDGANNPNEMETVTLDEQVTINTIKNSLSTTTEKTTNPVDYSTHTVETKIKRNHLNGSVFPSPEDSTATDSSRSSFEETTQQTVNENIAHPQNLQKSNYTSDSVKLDSSNEPKPNSFSTVSVSNEPSNENKMTSDEPPVLELNSHVPFLQVGGHVVTDSVMNTFEGNYETTTKNIKDKENIVSSTLLKSNYSDNNNHDFSTKQTNTEAVPSHKDLTNDTNERSTILENKQNEDKNTVEPETSTDMVFTSSHIPLTPGDLKMIAEYLINDTIKPVELNHSNYTPNEWLRGNLTSEKTISSIMSAANISVAVMNKTDDKFNKLVDKVNRKAGEPTSLGKIEKGKLSLGSNPLNKLKTDNKTGFIQGKSDEYFDSPKMNSESDILINDEAKNDLRDEKVEFGLTVNKHKLNPQNSTVKISGNATDNYQLDSTTPRGKDGEFSPPPSSTVRSFSLSDSDLRFDKVNPDGYPEVENNVSSKDHLKPKSSRTTADTQKEH